MMAEHTVRVRELRKARTWKTTSKIAFKHQLLLLLIAFSLPATPMVAVARSPDIRISAFVMGHSQWIWGNPFRILFMRDPLFTYTIYPLPPFLSMEGKAKLDRVYYPRTRALLTNVYNLTVFHDIRTQFTDRQVIDLDYAFREAGLTAMCGLCLGWEYAWQPTILADLLPISEHDSVSPFFRGYWVQFDRDRAPVFLAFIGLGIEKVIGTQYCTMKARQGATVWGTLKPYDIPWMVSWKPGGGNAGTQWLVSHTFEGWWAEENNPYSLDVATNMIFYSLGQPLIENLQGRREARRLFTNFRTQKSIVLSMLEWAESFGARVESISDKLNMLEAEMAIAIQHYLDQDYHSTISFLESVSLVAKEVSLEALRLKDRALYWVYVSEWLTITATALLSGAMVWSLMGRRRLYRPSGSTRMTTG